MNLKYLIVKIKQRYQRGLSWINYARDGVLMLILLKLFGIPITWIIPLGILVIASTMAIGYIDYRFGIWQTENAYVYSELNPYIKTMSERIENIESLLWEDWNDRDCEDCIAKWMNDYEPK